MKFNSRNGKGKDSFSGSIPHPPDKGQLLNERIYFKRELILKEKVLNYNAEKCLTSRSMKLNILAMNMKHPGKTSFYLLMQTLSCKNKLCR